MSPKLITWDWTFHAGISPWKSPLLFLSMQSTIIALYLWVGPCGMFCVHIVMLSRLSLCRYCLGSHNDEFSCAHFFCPA